MMAIAAALGTVGALWFAARLFGGGRPCPTSVAAFFDNPVATRLGGTALVIQRAGVTEGMRVLDAGCGPGRLTIPLARAVGTHGSVVALDVQAGMLDRVTANAARAGLSNISTVLSALEGGAPFLRTHAGTFDRILLVTVLGEVPDPVGALRALHAALKPNGVLSVTEMVIDPDYVRGARVHEMAEAAGFRVVERWGSPLLATTNLVRKAQAGDANAIQPQTVPPRP